MRGIGQQRGCFFVKGDGIVWALVCWFFCVIWIEFGDIDVESLLVFGWDGFLVDGVWMLKLFAWFVEFTSELFVVGEVLCVSLVEFFLLLQRLVVQPMPFSINVLFGVALGVRQDFMSEACWNVLARVKILFVELLKLLSVLLNVRRLILKLFFCIWVV